MMDSRTCRAGFLGLAAIAVCISAPALAQSSLGIGAAESVSAPVSSGFFGEMSRFVFQEQQKFYGLMTEALKAMRNDPAAGWTLAGLSFLYGILHAAGPGHGKAVISTYMVANEIALRRGIVLSFVSAMLQAGVAIAIISAVFLVLRGTAISQTETVFTLEVLSYAFIAVFGLWLLLRKIYPLALSIVRRRPAMAAMPAGGGNSIGMEHYFAATDDEMAKHAGHGGHHHHHHGPGEVCSSCGHAHMPDPEQISGERFRLREAASAVIAVGLRPCSGALIVLTFAFLNGMIVGGIGSVIAMAFGTAITVAILATLAVSAKNLAVRFAGGASSPLARRIQLAIEIAGAGMIALLGLVLLSGALATI